MDKQQEQMSQNPNQEIKYTSGFLNEDEEVNESEFDDLTEEQEASKLADNQQNKLKEEQPKKKAKRPRKTIEQEISELDAKREKLMEKKRRQEAHEKIVFGSLMIKLLKDMKSKGLSKDVSNILKSLNKYTYTYYKKNIEIIEKISNEIDAIKIEENILNKN